MLNFSIKINNLYLKTPLMLASGTWGMGENLNKYLTLKEIRSYIGALVTKSISLYPREGNPPPRLAETPCGLVNSIGIENPGIKEFKNTYLPKLKTFGIPLVVSLYGEKDEDFLNLVEELKNTEVDGIEINISCPNVGKGGILFSFDPLGVEKLIKSLKKIWHKYLAVKLSPIGTIYEIAEICEKEKVDAIVVANTYPALVVLGLKPLKILNGGLSGPAIKPLTLKLVYELSKKVNIPIIGCGGIFSGRDALEYLLCGAKAFQIGTANLINPRSCVNIIKELKDFKNELCNKGLTQE